MAEYKLGRRAPECAATGKTFEEGEAIVSAIFETDDGFERRDFGVDAFGALEDESYSFWRSQVPVTVEDERRLDFDLAMEFFLRLRKEADEERASLVYLLGLLLGRKRKLKLKGFKRTAKGEMLRLVVRGDEEDEEIEIPVPDVGPEDADRLQADLNRLFGIAVEEPETTSEEQAEPPEETEPSEQPPENPVE